MKLSCLQENLSKGLGIVSRAVATRSTLPITQNVLIATDQSRLKLAATNLEVAISCWVGAKIEEEGAITIPARLLTEFISSLPNDKIDIALNQRTLQLTCARFEARINGLDAQDFPPIPQVADGIATKIEIEALRDGISQVTFAAATEESRPVLTGIQLEFDGDKLAMAAADGFRLAVHDTSLLSAVKSKTALIVPARALNELSRFLTDQEEPVEITVNQQKSQILFRLKNIEMVSQLIQGAFPNYSQLIPQSYVTRAVVDVAEFLRAIRMASIFARDGSGIVRLVVTPGVELTPGKMNISARAEEVGDNVGEIDALIDGETSKIAFNAKYLSDVLSVLHQKQVALETTTSSSPGVLRPVGVDNYVHVVMPMFVQW
ncbi:MAG: DNA polymerase III subunit beta [Chloroflexi bacterium RBG_13_50_10]|nr:MAG: DNA polymerase III subunit beta [Chloroflexi bacterium RBG_13_50_10]